MLVPPQMDGLYHVVSRVVDRRKVFGEAEKKRFRDLLLAYAGFSGITVVAWCIMGNHFHLLLDVPAKANGGAQALSEEEVVRRIGLIHGPSASLELARQLSLCSAEESKTQLLHPYVRRMGDLGLMMKTLKQRFTQWFNRRHERRGTLWEDRYRSVIVEKSDSDGSMGGVAKIVAAYIDLNPVRAGITSNPAAYPWSSFGSSSANDVASRTSLARLWGMDADAALAEHMELLYEEGCAQRIAEEGPKSDRAPIAAPEGKGGGSRLKKSLRVPVPTALRLRLRHFTAGGILGSKAFLEKLSTTPGILDPTGESGKFAAKAGVIVPRGEWGASLRALRALRLRQVGQSDVAEKSID
ncbi:MAG: transposase [Verrucomicrobiales bacterium]